MSLGKMNFGLFFLNSVSPFKTDAQELKDGLEQIRVADELGYESVWIAEHNARSYGVVTSASVYLAAAAAITKRIKLGTAVVRLPLHHPLQVAEELNVVDIISDGRLYIGVGKGYDILEFQAYNVDFEDRHNRFTESLHILKAALTQEVVSYSGKYYNFKDIPIYPRPVQKPCPPLFVMVSGNDATIINAAKEGYSFFFGGLRHRDVLHKLELYRKTALEAGYTPEQVDERMARSGKLMFVYVAETTEQAREEYRERLEWYMSVRDNRPTFSSEDRDRNLTYEQFVEHENTIVGSPERVTEQIRQFRDKTGISNIICWMNIGGQKQENVLKSMRLFAEKVMPNFQ
jgi:alkanesulfonate monooxygenase SsuD/methylene tetrahydromethanopterin reductase-like flavin-dependent oxidoreductase (luciferase family)